VFADVVTLRADCRDKAVRDAFARVPRHEFMGQDPWFFTEHGEGVQASDPAIAYQDVGLGLTRGVPTGLPSLHARCIAACGVRPGERVIHVGAGTGYYTAILAELVGERGPVIAFELDRGLVQRAQKNLSQWPWVRLEASSGVTFEKATADVIYVSAGVEELPLGWLQALGPRGRLLFPLVPAGEEGVMVLVRSIGSPTIFSAKVVCRARFVPCVGTEDELVRSRLSDALRAGGVDSIRSLRIAPEVPDESAWFAGGAWWFSTRLAAKRQP
jgi:protein-L-isoaspartate(D-aspartate) O-methyltransferase